ncbi:hypothetical protein GM541_13635 [Streptococcus pneumoniae]|nr:hypothetical protein [Streptococcus pneumoniae]
MSLDLIGWLRYSGLAEVLMGLLFFWFFASLVVAVWASNRGRSGFAWWLLSM